MESGDEAAVAWDQVRQLGDTLDALKAELETTKAALRRAEKQLEREQVRANWISEGNDRLRAELDAVERDRADLQERLDVLLRTITTPAPNARPVPGPNQRNAGRKNAAGADRRDRDNSLDDTHHHEGLIERPVRAIRYPGGSNRVPRW